MAIFSNAVTLTGSAFDDFVLGDSAVTDNTLNGGDGNDYIIGDADADRKSTRLNSSHQ